MGCLSVTHASIPMMGYGTVYLLLVCLFVRSIADSPRLGYTTCIPLKGCWFLRWDRIKSSWYQLTKHAHFCFLSFQLCLPDTPVLMNNKVQKVVMGFFARGYPVDTVRLA